MIKDTRYLYLVRNVFTFEKPFVSVFRCVRTCAHKRERDGCNHFHEKQTVSLAKIDHGMNFVKEKVRSSLLYSTTIQTLDKEM